MTNLKRIIKIINLERLRHSASLIFYHVFLIEKNAIAQVSQLCELAIAPKIEQISKQRQESELRYPNCQGKVKFHKITFISIRFHLLYPSCLKKKMATMTCYDRLLTPPRLSPKFAGNHTPRSRRNSVMRSNPLILDTIFHPKYAALKAKNSPMNYPSTPILTTI